MNYENDTAYKRVLRAIEHLQLGTICTNNDIATLAGVSASEVSNAKARMMQTGKVKALNYRIWVRCEADSTHGVPMVPMSVETRELCRKYHVRFDVPPPVEPSKPIAAFHKGYKVPEHKSEFRVGDHVRVVRCHRRNKTLRVGDKGTVKTVTPYAIAVDFGDKRVVTYISASASKSLERIVHVPEPMPVPVSRVEKEQPKTFSMLHAVVAFIGGVIGGVLCNLICRMVR